MKERGMIFNGEMVRAILDGRKTQTRRIMKVQPEPSKSRPGDFWFSSKKLESMVHVSDLAPGNSPIADCHLFYQEHCCPYGLPGDRIWVRETFGDCGARLVYRADTDDGAKCKVKRWTPSIHMPRWASRILLEITDVRVERLASISNEDARTEGYPAEREADGGNSDPWLWFRDLWDGIYPEQSFKNNPWVWVIEFKVVPNVQDNPA
ncbi:hypothetical protein [Citrobacter sp. wls714]|uniref:hypothetical protein n=1 Tax=Citrobacter sp. wls714 TaxID=2576422 RepID=UPI0010C9B236|nr:hypothetical protein [Citrobacter sp. wls714]TKU48098.1 hypothetical protein FDX11_10350 [Citrobacter sp. wls714]